ncbi:MAG: serine hydrolase [Chloroflexi bacterium]|nr:serine hydrolase [Chloroflexota bacterium]
MMLHIAQLETRIRAAMQEAKVPGLALSIVADGELHYAAGFGTTSVEDGGQAVTPATVFRIGSTSKPIAAIVILRLVDEGLLDLDVPICEILPDFQLSERGAVDHINLRLLLSHQSGLPSAANYLGSREASEFRRLIYEVLPEFPLLAPPGELWSYSNPGIDLAAFVASTVTGESYAELAQRLLFEPLGLKRTTLDPLVAASYPFAQSHYTDEAGELRVWHRIADNVLHHASGFAFSTALDMARWAQFMLQGGSWQGERLLSAASLAAMQGPEVRFPGLTVGGYGFGLLMVEHQGIRRYLHPGRIDGYAHYWSYLPEHKAAITLQCNHASHWAPHEESLAREIFRQLLDLPDERRRFPSATVPKTQLQRLVGWYAANPLGLLELREEGGQLIATLNGEQHRLKVANDTLFYAAIEGEPIPLQIHAPADENGAHPQVSVIRQFPMPQTFRRLRIAAEEASPVAHWTIYEGTYRNDRELLEVTLEETDSQPQLTVRHPLFGAKPIPAKPIGAHRFLLPTGVLEFEPDESGDCRAVRVGFSLVFVRQAT